MVVLCVCVSGCNCGPAAGPDGGIDAGIDAGPVAGAIAGRVLSYEGCQVEPVILAGVALGLPDGGVLNTQTDLTGRFQFPSVEAGRWQVAVAPPADRAEQLGTHQLPVVVRLGLESELTFFLAPACPATGSLSAYEGSPVTITVDCGFFTAGIIARPLDFALPDGGTSVDRVRVVIAAPSFQYLPTEHTDFGGLRTMPGAMEALTPTDAGALLLSSGPMEVRVFDANTGDPLSIAPGRSIDLLLPLTPDSPIDTSMQAFRFAPDLGKWVEKGEASWQSGSESPDFWQTTVTELGWWNADRVQAQTSCVRGRVTLGGKASAGADVMTYGSDSSQAFRANADQDGSFCVETGANAQMWVVARRSTAGFAPALDAQAEKQITSGAGGERCGGSASGCVDVGELQLIEPAGACVSGTLVDSSTQLPDGGVPRVTEPVLISGRPPPTSNRQPACSQQVPLLGVQPSGAGGFCAALPVVQDQLGFAATSGNCMVSYPAPALDGGTCGGPGCADLAIVDLYCAE